MPTVGTLNIDLRMGTAALIAGASKAASTISKMADSIKGSFVKMSMSLTPVVDVGQIVGGIKAIATAQSKFIDDTGKLADRLNITTEAFVGMAHAADLAGVGADEFGGMLEKLQKNLGKFAEDEGKTQEVVEGLGISLKDLQRQDLDKTFLDITDAIAKTHDPLKRSELLIALFGKSGQKLANTMMAGKQSIRDAMLEAKELGMTFSRFDAAKVEAANDAFTRMKGALAGIGNTLTIGLAPYFEVAFNKAREFIKTHGQEMAKMFVSSATAFIDGLQKAYEIVLRIGSEIGSMIDAIGLAIEEFGKSMFNQALMQGGRNIAAAGVGMKMRLNDKANQAADAPRWAAKANEAAGKVADAFVEGMKVNMIARMKIMFVRAAEDFKDLLVRNGFGFMVRGDAKQQAVADQLNAERAAHARERAANAQQQRIAGAQATRDSVQSPMQVWAKRQAELNSQLKVGQEAAKELSSAQITYRNAVNQMKAASGAIGGPAGAAGSANAEFLQKLADKQTEAALAKAAGGILPDEYAKATLQNKEQLAAALGKGGGVFSPAASGAEFGSANAQSIIAGSKMNSASGSTQQNTANLLREARKQTAKQDIMAAAAVQQVEAMRNFQVVNF